MLRKSTPWGAAALPFLLVACATPLPPSPVAPPLPSQWHAPLPHQGQSADLAQWWQQWNDPVLLALIESTQTASPTLDAAHARLMQARARLDGTQANQGPRLDGSASVNRGRQTSLAGAPLATVAQIQAQASWEADLFGQNRAASTAASQRLQGAQAAWHEARVSLAAEVARLYTDYRSCIHSLTLARQDVDSRQTSARLTLASATAGLSAPGTLALAQASAAEGAARLHQQAAACDLGVKALVALSGQAEPTLRSQLEVSNTPFRHDASADTATFSVASIPANALVQRPDLYQAEREVAAASAELGSAMADRYPRLSLSGAIGQTNLRMGGTTLDLSTWTLGPIALSLPIWDNGRIAANVGAATARYDEAAANYRAKARQAVREVEEALVGLEAARQRQAELQTAAKGYQRAFLATELRYQNGLANLVELEDLRRAWLNAQTAAIAQQRDTRQTWIALYRAAGGGWTPNATATP